MNQDATEEGLVLRSLDYRDHQKIITLFTKTRGVISLIVKGISQKKSHLLSLTSPFTHGEYCFSIGRSDLYQFKEGHPLTTHLALRSNLKHLQAASAMIHALLASQLPGKPAPKLYALTLTYLGKLSQSKDTASLTSSFLLKLLKHEGHLALSPHCVHCQRPATHLCHGEPHCPAHLPGKGYPFTKGEWEALMVLTETRSIKTLEETVVSLALQEKITTLVREQF